jgi:hypothetical protein
MQLIEDWQMIELDLLGGKGPGNARVQSGSS